MTDVLILATGGTIDKIYTPRTGALEIGEPFATEVLRLTGQTAEEVRPLLGKDSLEFDDTDRQTMFDAVAGAAEGRILLTHGTDTMIETARKLRGVAGKTIVLTGAMVPGRVYASDAGFNIGFALAMVRTLPAGVYIAMHGTIFAPENVRKNREASRFEAIG